jgi:hypothetical protein
MTDESIQLDQPDTPDAKGAGDEPKKKKDIAGTFMVIFSVLAFACLTAALVLQWMEYSYYRGTPKEGDPFAERVLIPPQR